LAAAIHGFNWVTALLISVACPTITWLVRHCGAYRVTFQNVVRSLVLRSLALPQTSPLGVPKPIITAMLVLPMLVIPGLIMRGTDGRLPMAADFDTLWRSQHLIEGVPEWDPLASLTALVMRLSTVDALHVAGAIRLTVSWLTPVACAALILESG